MKVISMSNRKRLSELFTVISKYSVLFIFLIILIALYFANSYADPISFFPLILLIVLPSLIQSLIDSMKNVVIAPERKEITFKTLFSQKTIYIPQIVSFDYETIRARRGKNPIGPRYSTTYLTLRDKFKGELIRYPIDPLSQEELTAALNEIIKPATPVSERLGGGPNRLV